MALNGLFCADVPLRNYSLTFESTDCVYPLRDSQDELTWAAIEMVYPSGDGRSPILVLTWPALIIRLIDATNN